MKRVRLGHVLRLRKEIVHPYEKPQGTATFVGLEHIEVGTGLRIGSLDVDLARLTGRKPKFCKGDIVYGYLRPYLNKVWVAEFDGVCSVDQYVYEVDRSLADPEFIAWFMRSPDYLARARVESGPGQLPRIRLEEVAAVEVGLPDLDGQRRLLNAIREQIGLAARARRATTAQLEAAQTLPSAYLRAIFAGREGRTWPVRKVAECCQRIDYGFTASAEPYSGGARFLRITDIQEGAVDWDLVPGCDISPAAEVEKKLLDGDIVFARTGGTTGKSFLIKHPPRAVFASYLIRLRPGEELVPEYLCAFFRSDDYWRQVRFSARGGAQPNVNATSLGNIQIPVPALGDQQRVVAALNARLGQAERLLKEIDRRRTSVEALPPVLLHRVFGGWP